MGDIMNNQTVQEMGFEETKKSQLQWVISMEDKNGVCESDFSETDSEDSLESSSSSSELADDSSSSSSSSCGPLFELSELMSQLPIKRGLSKHYQGKSQSFASLASVKSLEDLAKKSNYSYKSRRSMKACKSYAGGLDGQSQRLSPKATISKKGSSNTSLFSSLGKMSSFMAS